jgi:hypothetical protein
MSRQLYPHLGVAVDTEPFYSDLVRRYSRAHVPGGAAERRRVRQEIKEKTQGMDRWLVEHGYQCGRDYQQTETGYRFASDELATFFRLAWS